MARRTFLFTALLVVCACVFAADEYKGPRPPKPDIPYLLHADSLVPTEAVEAAQQNRKGDSVYTIQGASSSAKTPLAEPIFIMESQHIQPENLELYRLDVRNGNREVSLSGKHRRGSSRPVHLTVTKLGENLSRIEVQDTLENGEYSLSPAGSNTAFCFQVY